MARLVIFDDRVRAVELPDRQIIIGRSKKVDVPINDGLLSRKHCSILSVGGGYRLLDLKSSNGTYLNGERIEKVDLSSDDIIEIGQTVIVFMEDGVWSRGEALAHLRNPLKAQELIGRIKHPSRAGGGPSKIPLSRVGAPVPPEKGLQKAGRGRRDRGASPAADPRSFPDLEEALEDFIAHRAVLFLLKASPELRRVVGDVIRGVLRPAGQVSDPPAPKELRARIKAQLRSRLRNLPASGDAEDSTSGDSKGEPLRPEGEGRTPEDGK